MELQIIRAREFIRLGAKGHFDMDASKAVLAQLATACCKRGINQALLDLRALHPGPKPVFSPNNLVTLVNTFREAGFTHQQRLAVLYSEDPHHRARLFAFIAKLRGWKVQAFDGFEEALLWLSSGEESHAEKEFSPAAKRVAVRQLKNSNAASQPKPAINPRLQVKSKIAPAGSRHAPSPVSVRGGKTKDSSARVSATARRLA